MHNPSRLFFVLTLSVACDACFFRKPAVVFTPPPPQTHPQTIQSNEVPVLPPAPDLNAEIAPSLPETPTNMPPQVEPPPPPPPRRGPVATAPPKPAVPALPPAPEIPPPPKLGQIFTADQLRDYNRTLEESLERVRRVLAAVGTKNLNAEQSEIASRIRTFQRQAEQARDQDLVTAVNLARRADLLAQDLIGRLP
jgi:hypothetical protein